MVKTQVRFFVSYAHIDESAGSRLLDLLRVQMAPSAKYDFRLWDDRAILTGELWEEEILQAIAESDLGLLLVSPAFLSSKFITDHELPRFVGNESKPSIPVEHETVNFGKHDLKGLQEHQLFRLDRKKSFAKCVGRDRTRFVEQLYEQIEQRLDRLGF